MHRIQEFFKETLRYIAVGLLSAFVNLATYFICNWGFEINYLVSNLAAWALTVLVSYIADKHFVFRSKVSGAAAVIKEFVLFVNSRVISLVVDQLLMWIFVGFLEYDSSIVKLVNSVVVVLINYVISRLIFKGKMQGGKGEKL